MGKIPSHKRSQFVRTPSRYLISGHDVRLYLHCQSGSHKAFAQKMRRCSSRSDERLPVAQCRVTGVRAGCPDGRHLCPRKGSPLRAPREKAPPCWVSSSLVHDQVRQKRREALKTALYTCGLGPDHLISRFVHAKLLQSCPTLQLYEPGSSVRGILQARILKWVAISSSRGSSQPGGRTSISVSPTLAGGFFPTSATWEARTF